MAKHSVIQKESHLMFQSSRLYEQILIQRHY